jgi:geranylgeranyl diphosphate synthase type I
MARSSARGERSDESTVAFRNLLAHTKPAVEARLEELFADRLAARTKLGKEVRGVVEIARDLTLRGGKRFRAALLAAAYLGVKPRGSKEVALAGGVALELLQSYLLIQDDWMDGDVERRGGPSAHVALARRLGSERDGAIGAILAGDLVWGMAVEAVGATSAPTDVRLEATRELIRIHEDVVMGQVLDTVAQNADIEELHALKTGSYTVRGPLVMGAKLAGAPAATLRALTAYADPLGVAFQLRDDLLGVFGTEAESGRPAGSDLMSAKRTSVLSYAMPRLAGRQARAVASVWKRRGAKPAAVATAVRAVEETGARAHVEKRLTALCDEAEARASKLPLSPRARLELKGAVIAVRGVPGGRDAR